MFSKEELNNIEAFENQKPMSLHWELRMILYLGILLFVGGISILVYENIDTIGHSIIIAVITLLNIIGAYYIFKNKLPFSWQVQQHSNVFFDYVVLLSCLLFGVLIGYVQYQYDLFGVHWGLATLFPTLVYFAAAYLFDHRGALSLGITGLAAWIGLSVTPLELLSKNDFFSITIINSAILLGVLLIGFTELSTKKDWKIHFIDTFHQFASNMTFIALLSAMFTDYLKWIAFPLLLGTGFYYYKYAVQKKSFLFLLLSVMYCYIGLTYMIFHLLIDVGNELSFSFGLFYVAASCVGIILFFIYYKRILGIVND